MTDEDPLRKLYREGLSECGFDAAAVEQGLQMLETGRYVGFADVIASMEISGSRPGVREHQVSVVVQQMRAHEVAARVAERGARASLHVAADRAQAAEDKALAEAVEERRSRAMLEVFKQMTPAEQDGGRMRPEIAEAWVWATGVERWARARPAAPRPSWVGRAPAPSSKRISEATTGPSSGAVTRNPDGSTTVIHGRVSNTYIPVEEIDLAETFRELGLPEDAAEHAARGR